MSETETAAAALQVDLVFVALVLFAVFGFLFIGIWGVAQKSASKADFAALVTRLSAVEHRVEQADSRVVDVERQIARLPTQEHVHQLDLKVEKTAVTLDKIERQVDRVHEYLMSEARRRGGDREEAPA